MVMEVWYSVAKHIHVLIQSVLEKKSKYYLKYHNKSRDKKINKSITKQTHKVSKTWLEMPVISKCKSRDEDSNSSQLGDQTKKDKKD